jgi:hypothetical protein
MLDLNQGRKHEKPRMLHMLLAVKPCLLHMLWVAILYLLRMTGVVKLGAVLTVCFWVKFGAEAQRRVRWK